LGFAVGRAARDGAIGNLHDLQHGNVSGAASEAVAAARALGGDEQLGGARVLRERLGQMGFSVVAPRRGVPLGTQFSSDYAGHIDVGPNGERLLIALSTMGQIVEIDTASGAPLWRYRKIFSAAGYPGAASDERRAVSVEAFGASYVDKQTFAPVFGYQ